VLSAQPRGPPPATTSRRGSPPAAVWDTTCNMLIDDEVLERKFEGRFNFYFITIWWLDEAFKYKSISSYNTKRNSILWKFTVRSLADEDPSCRDPCINKDPPEAKSIYILMLPVIVMLLFCAVCAENGELNQNLLFVQKHQAFFYPSNLFL
jgi:hypothetical protein